MGNDLDLTTIHEDDVACSPLEEGNYSFVHFDVETTGFGKI